MSKNIKKALAKAINKTIIGNAVDITAYYEELREKHSLVWRFLNHYKFEKMSPHSQSEIFSNRLRIARELHGENISYLPLTPIGAGKSMHIFEQDKESFLLENITSAILNLENIEFIKVLNKKSNTITIDEFNELTSQTLLMSEKTFNNLSNPDDALYLKADSTWSINLSDNKFLTPSYKAHIVSAGHTIPWVESAVQIETFKIERWKDHTVYILPYVTNNTIYVFDTTPIGTCMCPEQFYVFPDSKIQKQEIQLLGFYALGMIIDKIPNKVILED